MDKRHLIEIDSVGDAMFDDIIDVRSPSEYAQDHIPGAINCPVLNDAERAEIGTLYVQVSPFEARKKGAALVSRNIAAHLEKKFHDKDKRWKPLIYCWRGGQRSGSMQTVMREIGWDAILLKGGYKAYRSRVLEQLEQLPSRFRYIVIGGPTGSGKTMLLNILGDLDAQILDLEEMAEHKGSVLGINPVNRAQSQKSFDTKLAARLSAFDPARPVFVEAESRRIGIVQLPLSLYEGMKGGILVIPELPLDERVSYLSSEYAWFKNHPENLKEPFRAQSRQRQGDDCKMALPDRLR